MRIFGDDDASIYRHELIYVVGSETQDDAVDLIDGWLAVKQNFSTKVTLLPRTSVCRAQCAIHVPSIYTASKKHQDY